jgi:hypothetical protein
MPSLEDDAMPMANLLKARQPHVLTVALDPEGTGPDTHYKVLLVSALGSARLDPCVLWCFQHRRCYLLFGHIIWSQCVWLSFLFLLLFSVRL